MKLFKLSLRRGSIFSIIAFLFYLLVGLAHSILPENHNVLPSSNDPVAIYSNQLGDDLTALYIDAIRQAQESVILVIYALKDPKIISALYQKQAEGIPVTIICDAEATIGLSRQIPQATIVKRVVQNGLVHQKILIVDKARIILGSANLTTESLRTHGNLVFALDNAALGRKLSEKVLSMNDEGGSTRLEHLETEVGGQHLELWMLPDDSQATKRIIALFREARKTIDVAMFTWTRKDFAQELIKASQQGVKVEAVLDNRSGMGASAPVVKMLRKAGIPLKLSTGMGLLHHKYVCIDNRVLVNGSANWTHNAFHVNDDCFIVLYPLTPTQQDKMDRLWQYLQNHSR